MNPLLVPELFHCILDCLSISLSLAEGRAKLEERRTLAALARTCRAFSEPSLDRLWCSLDSLLPLVRSFADVVDEARVKTPPSPLEWFHINRYSSRIQELTLGTEYLSLHFLQCTNLVLPNLRGLRWERPFSPLRIGQTISTSDPITFLWPFLTSKIATLEMTLASASTPKFQSFLENYPSLCPNLKSIKFSLFSSGVPAITIESFSRAICRHTDWQRVEISCPIDNTALKHLGTSSTLKVASLTITADEPCFAPLDTPFPNVTNLAVTLSNRLVGATHLLRAHDQAFRSFGVTLRNSQITTTEDVSTLFSSIASTPRIHSLQSIIITRKRFQRVPFRLPTSTGDIHGLSYETFRPIVTLVHLHVLVINLGNPIAIDDDEFAHLVCNWPCLEVLRLTGGCEEHPEKSLSLKSLLSLLVSCRKLRDISITLDARQVPFMDTDAESDVCSRSVSGLFFLNSPIEHPKLVEEFLFKHMPSVAYVRAMFTQRLPVEDRNYSQSWRQVYMFRKSRFESGGTGADQVNTNMTVGPGAPVVRVLCRYPIPHGR